MIGGLILESEEERTRPASPGNAAGYFRETSIAGASILKAFGFNIDEVDLVLPLADKTGA